ncbi:UNVERIFIED_CONTAM: hypothetical protein HDU68_011353 [Siphonaria sp. JEL0065]|nr:hypothetical protein HDU68_011353 [Siphonaria sp. JEL0065]
MSHLRFSKLPFSYSMALLRLTGFHYRSLQLIGKPHSGNTKNEPKISWHFKSFPLYKNSQIIEEALVILVADSRWLTDLCDRNLLLLWACANGAVSIALCAFKHGTTQDTLFEGIVTAAAFGQLEVFETLVEWEENTTCKKVALEVASEYGHLQIVDSLLQDFAVNPSESGCTALDAACKNGHLGIVRRLLGDGRCDPGARSNGALILAARYGYSDLVSLLIEDGRVDVNAQTGHALLSPSIQGHKDVVQVLLNNGADLRIAKFKPFYLAVEAGNVALVRTFIQNSDWYYALWMRIHVVSQLPRGRFSIVDCLTLMF